MVRDVRDVTPRSRAATRWVFWIMVVVFFAATLTLAVCGADDGDLNPRDTAAIAVGYLALFLFVQIFQWMRRGTTAYPALIAVAMGTVSALVLAGGAYWHCAGSGTPGLTQAVWVGGIFFGSAAMPFGAVPGCPAQPPLSLELAQVMALGVIFFAAARLVLSFIENVAQQFRIRRARNLVLVVGAGDRIAYANTLEYKPETLTVSVGDDVVARQMATPRAGVLHLSGQLSTPDLFQSLLRHRRRGTNLREIHLIDPDTTTNLRRFEAIRDAVGRLPQYRVLQALMRIENPWAAEEWRRNPPDFDGWVVDAFSSYETTAHQLLRQVMAEKHDRLILCGGGFLALAVCEVVSRLERESAGVAAALVGHGLPASDEHVPAVTLLGPNARALSENHTVHQGRFGNPKSHFDVIETPLTREVVEQVAGTANTPAIVFSEPEETMPFEIAARHDQWVIFAFDAGATGVAERALVGKARPFGLALRFAGDPVSDWERTARRVHEFYSALWNNPNSPTARPWSELDSFYRESNVRQVINFIHTARRVGLAWGANEAHAPAGSGTLTDAQVSDLAQVEHESWRAFMQQYGWKRGPRDNGKKMHPALMPWSELGDEDRAKTILGVRASLVFFEALEVFGYVPYQMKGWVPWQPYERCGEVTAVRLERETSWTTADGQTLTGESGDWLITGQDGRQWILGDEQLRETHRNVADDVWRRQGTVVARPAVPGEVIHTSEGKSVASDGDWVIRDTGDDIRIVSAQHFAANYCEGGTGG